MYTYLLRTTGAIYLPRVNQVLSLTKLITSKSIPVSPKLAEPMTDMGKSTFRAIHSIEQCSTHSSACAPNFPAVLCRCSSRRRGSRIHNYIIYLVGGDNVSKYFFRIGRKKKR